MTSTPYRCLSKEQRRKADARSIAGTYMRRGLLNPRPCSDCGTTVDVVKHHEDYDKPLDVTWLCRGCHAARHRLEKERANEPS